MLSTCECVSTLSYTCAIIYIYICAEIWEAKYTHIYMNLDHHLRADICSFIHALILFVWNIATCDASSLVPNAADVGDCSSVLASGKSCSNIPTHGKACFASTCVDGNLTAGVCTGPPPPLHGQFRQSAAANIAHPPSLPPSLPPFTFVYILSNERFSAIFANWSLRQCLP